MRRHDVKVLSQSEKKFTRGLWECVFSEDSVDFLDYYYNYKCRTNKIYAIEHDKEVISMLQCNPYNLCVNGEKVEIDYIVGVATKESFRHQGMMAGLLNKALNDMHKEGKPFAFLMPASEAIYKPFGFRFIYGQQVLKKIFAEEKKCDCKYAEGDIEIRLLLEDEYEDLSCKINAVLSKKYDVFTLKSKEYFEDLRFQYESDGTSIMAILKNNNVAGYFAYWISEETAEINEIVCFDINEEAAVEAVTEYIRKNHEAAGIVFRSVAGETEHRIMARITNVKKMLERVYAHKNLVIKLTVKDDIIEANSNEYLWRVGDNYSDVYELSQGKVCQEKVNTLDDVRLCEIELNIEELAEWIFKGEYTALLNNKTETKGECFKYIKTLNRVFINEIV